MAKTMLARFPSPCPFCGMGVAVKSKIVLAECEEWMHPVCARFSDAGKTFKDLLAARRVAKRARELRVTVTPRPYSRRPAREEIF